MYTRLRVYVHPQLHLSSLPRDKLVTSIMALTRQQISFNPRDKVYGLYGYLSAIGFRNLPPVNYTSPVSHVYRDFTRYASQQDQSLAVLYQLGCQDSLEDLPSWVPDWSKRIFWKVMRERFTASKSSPFRFIFSENDELHVPAIIIDSVDENGEIIEEVQMLSSDGTSTVYLSFIVRRIKTYKTWCSLASKLHNYPTGESFLEVFPRTILQNSDGVVSEEDIREFSTWYHLLIAYDHPHGQEVVYVVEEVVDFAVEEHMGNVVQR